MTNVTASSIGQIVGRLLAGPKETLADFLTPGRVVTADVISVYKDRAILSLARGVLLEVRLQAALAERQRVSLQVEPQQQQAHKANQEMTTVVLRLVDQDAEGKPAQGQVVRGEAKLLSRGEAHAEARAAREAGQRTTGAPADIPAGRPAPPPPPRGLVYEPPPGALRMPATQAQAASQPAAPQGAPAQAAPAQGAPAPGAAAPSQPAAVPGAPAPPQPAAGGTPAQAAAQPAAPQGAPAPAQPAAGGEQGQPVPTGGQGTAAQGAAAPAAPPPGAAARGAATAATAQPAPAQPAQAQSAPPQASPPEAGRAPAPAQATQAPAAAQASPAAQAAAQTQAAAQPQAAAPPPVPPPVPPPAMPITVQGEMVAWLPLPLPDGKQGWAQVKVEEDKRKKAKRKGERYYQVRIWWDTPGIGTVQVLLDAAPEGRLIGLFTVAAASLRAAIEERLPRLSESLEKAGYSAQFAARVSRPGEPQAPATTGNNVLDRRV